MGRGRRGGDWLRIGWIGAFDIINNHLLRVELLNKNLFEHLRFKLFSATIIIGAAIFCYDCNTSIIVTLSKIQTFSYVVYRLHLGRGNFVFDDNPDNIQEMNPIWHFIEEILQVDVFVAAFSVDVDTIDSLYCCWNIGSVV